MSSIKLVQDPTSSKRHCIICRRSGSILICHGCQLTYCAKHVRQHRQELTSQLESIMHNHDVLREDIEQTNNEYLYLRKIDQWEKESMKKIQQIAARTRDDVREIVDKSKRQLLKISRDLNSHLHSSWKTDDFAENDLKNWIKQLHDLRLQMKSTYSFQLIEDQRYPIYPLTITRNHLQGNKSFKLNPEEYFFKALNHSASIENDGLIAKHIGPDLDYAHILGKQIYSQGRHTIRFQIFHCTPPYTIFFGCISSEIPLKLIHYNSSFVVGWFGYNEIYQHGIWNNNFNLHGYESNEIQSNDILQLIFDCNQKQILFIHERLNKTYRLAVNVTKTPLPWRILLVLVHEHDSVKILY